MAERRHHHTFPLHENIERPIPRWTLDIKVTVVGVFVIGLIHNRRTMNSGGIGERIIAGLPSLVVLIVCDIK